MRKHSIQDYVDAGYRIQREVRIYATDKYGITECVPELAYIETFDEDLWNKKQTEAK